MFVGGAYLVCNEMIVMLRTSGFLITCLLILVLVGVRMLVLLSCEILI